MKVNKCARPKKVTKRLNVHTTQNPTSSFNCFKTLQLPSHWTDKSVGILKATFCKIEHLGHVPQISSCVTINLDHTWEVHVYGKKVTSSVLNDVNAKLNPASFLQLLQLLDNCRVCTGHPEEEFVSLLESRKGCIVSSDGNQAAYIDRSIPVVDADGKTVHTTVRSAACEIITAVFLLHRIQS